MIITTTDLIPGKEYEIIDIIFGTLIRITKTMFGNDIYSSLERRAIKLGADAVVGVKPDYSSNALFQIQVIWEQQLNLFNLN